MQHRAGFINIVGKPNAGKSTLMNHLVGERLSIITPKAQTTRHRILGIVNEEDWQIVFSDTPGYIHEPGYTLHQAMNAAVLESLEDADVLLVLIDATSPELADTLLELITKLTIPIAIGINKVDAVAGPIVDQIKKEWKTRLPNAPQFDLVATEGLGLGPLTQFFLEQIPESPPYFPKDQLTDRPERFFVAEIIREKILEQYRQEIPYSVEVEVTAFKESDDLTRIEATIYVNRKTQKPIIIGKGGSGIKQLGTAARKTMEEWLQNKVFLELHVKVREKWRDDENQLRKFGYQQ